MSTQLKITTADKISVALLINDISKVREFTHIFRSMKIIPHFYENLQDFWKGTLQSIPTLAIVDVKKMSEGGLLIKNHPYVKNNELPLCFYCEEESRPLLFSTFDIYNLGIISQGLPFSGQLKSILFRLNKINELGQANKDLEIEKKRYERNISKLLETGQKQKEKEFNEKLYDSIVGRFEKCRDRESFFKSLVSVFSSVREFYQFSFMELNIGGQKLVSPETSSQKYKKIPSLWLGRHCEEGIEAFAQNMAGEVIRDILGGEAITLNITGEHDSPDCLLFIRPADEDVALNFDWKGFERYLSGLYCHFGLKTGVKKDSDKKLIPSWELMSLLDECSFNLKKQGEAIPWNLIDIDFSNLVNFIHEKKTVRFYWGRFFQEFFSRFESFHKVDFKLAPISSSRFGILVPQDNGSEAFIALRSHCKSFSYWKYFEDIDTVIARDLTAETKMVPFSSRSYLELLRTTTQEKVDLEQKAKERTKKMIWGDAPSTNM